MNRAARWRWAAQGVALLLALALGTWLDLRDLPSGMFVLALLCAVPLTAGLAVQGGRMGFWFANARLAGSLAAGLIALGIVMIGTYLILTTAEQLLGIETWKLSEILRIVSLCFALPVFCLSLARLDNVDPAEAQDNVLLRVVATATDALLIPLMLILGAVIHVYAARIAIVRELPKGQIGWIVPVYLLLGYGVFLLAQGPERYLPRLRILFERLFIPGTLIPLLLLALAAWVRIAAYGLTNDRYLLTLIVAGGVILAGAALVRRPYEIRLVPLTAGALALLGAFGPPITIVGTGGSESVTTAIGEPEPETFDFFEGSVLRLPSVTVIRYFRVEETDPWMSGNGPSAFEVRLRDHELEVSGDGATTRFDLSPLLSMKRPEGEAKPPVLHSVEGRKGDLVVTRFDRGKGPDGPAIRTLWGKAVLY